jgi:hypothetical protein
VARVARIRSGAPAGALAPAGVLAPNVRTLTRVVGLQEYGTASVRTLLLILLGAVSFVLLIVWARRSARCSPEDLFHTGTVRAWHRDLERPNYRRSVSIRADKAAGCCRRLGW